ncbi:MAG: UbiA family prenyltransferase [Deltaproteobacteria bacterium]|nr:UbiA family prenyltransferase [Deltaproteobacteria bacterium]
MKAECPAITAADTRISRIRDWMRLVKLPISVMNALAVVAGYALCSPVVGPGVIPGALGVGLLAGGCGALNNYQDRRMDACFPRTSRRPLPRRAILPAPALACAALLIAGGVIGLWVSRPGPYAAGLGIAAVFLYNGLYTPLKYKTVLAVIPGAMCGMLPPLIGWVSAGGGAQPSHILLLMVIIGVWQLPHFWLILLSDAPFYRKAAMPNMLHLFSIRQLHRLLFIWVLAFVSLALFLPVIGIVTNGWLGGLLVCHLVLVGVLSGSILRLRKRTGRPYALLFNWLNSSIGMTLLVISLDRWV